MKRPILHVGLILFVGALALGQAGCHQAETAKTTDYTPKPADDPTAWTDKDTDKSKSDSASGSSSLPKGSAVKGAWSSEGQDIERSLGIGK